MQDKTDAEAGKAASSKVELYIFPEVLEVEHKEINDRRQRLARQRRRESGGSPPGRDESCRVAPLAPSEGGPFHNPSEKKSASRFTRRSRERHRDGAQPTAGSNLPTPVPLNLNGLCLSGGGIRSAAVCLGALQALNANRAIDCVDYLSTVSGGGYIGASLTVAASPPIAHVSALSSTTPAPAPRAVNSASSEQRIDAAFGKDVKDSPFVAHLRNYSNYLLPRGRSNIQNYSEAAAILLRGPLINLILVLLAILSLAALTALVYPAVYDLCRDGFLSTAIRPASRWPDVLVEPGAFRPTKIVAGVLALALVGWVLWRSLATFLMQSSNKVVAWARWGFLEGVDASRAANDADSRSLRIARALILLLGFTAVLDFQPLALRWLDSYQAGSNDSALNLQRVMAILAAASGAVATFGGVLGRFLRTTEQSKGTKALLLRTAPRRSSL